jgi:uncharacterized membrane protein YuzA (DUF378 family)
MKILDWIALILVIIGGLNWGLVGLFNYNVVSAIFGDASTLSNIVFDLVGLAAIWIAFMSPRYVKRTGMGGI